MVEFLQSYGIWIFGGLFLLMMLRGRGRGMGCGMGGHQHDHGDDRDENRETTAGENKSSDSRRSSGCH